MAHINKTTTNTDGSRPDRLRNIGPNKHRGNSSPARNQSAKLNYERYLSQAQAEARSGNLVEAENCYQHAEHYFRTINNRMIASH
ncbi:DUF4167 domain-containing protein [Phyllobacterium sp. SB3]|uniref:DUF4167 domain-containing protein n=1 Tax=Phyllobacterium sp. SB3 TaxID=3156073 RepID=UPI0032AECB44